ncbi:hypothetical protein PHLH7_01730 [Pseudomonas sp. Ost2]|nr:hypothetical protein PHLH7_01730 [Pseudomonas sp. Ost2]
MAAAARRIASKPAPTGNGLAHGTCGRHHCPVGAGLLAMTSGQTTQHPSGQAIAGARSQSSCLAGIGRPNQ